MGSSVAATARAALSAELVGEALGHERLRAAAGELSSLLRSSTLAVAESCTVGLVSEALGAADGASEWFRGGLVAYQTEVKTRLLGIDPGSVVSERAAREMAEGCARLFDAEVALAITGAAGPGGLDGAEPGTVCIGWWRDDTAHALTFRFEGEPGSVARAAALTGLHHLVAVLTPPRTAPGAKGTHDR